MQYTPIRLTMTALACGAVLTLAACGNRDADRSVGQGTGSTVDQTAGQRVDSALGTMDRKVDAAGNEVSSTAGTMADTARDAAITTQINADLARDPELSALQIDVDTTNGKVVLTGTAPTDTAKDRASAKAQAVAGVMEVDNRLRVGS